MIKDIDISHYYKKFIETSNDDMAKYNKELDVEKEKKITCSGLRVWNHQGFAKD